MHKFFTKRTHANLLVSLIFFSQLSIGNAQSLIGDKCDQCDLSTHTIDGGEYKSFSMTYADLSETKFINVSFEKSKFNNSNFSSAVFKNANFIKCKFDVADLSEMQISDTNLEKSEFAYAELDDASIKNVIAKDVKK